MYSFFLNDEIKTPFSRQNTETRTETLMNELVNGQKIQHSLKFWLYINCLFNYVVLINAIFMSTGNILTRKLSSIFMNRSSFRVRWMVGVQIRDFVTPESSVHTLSAVCGLAEVTKALWFKAQFVKYSQNLMVHPKI